jgi:hypothetical protein
MPQCVKGVPDCHLIIAGSCYLILLLSVISVGICSYFVNNYHNTQKCTIVGVTDIETAYDRGSFWYFQIEFSAPNCTSIEAYTYSNHVYSYIVGAHTKYSNRTSITCYSYKDRDQCDVALVRSEHPSFLVGIIVSLLAAAASFVTAGVMTCYYCEGREDTDRRRRGSQVRNLNDLDAEL